jgi:Arc/MetJ-type ribon-helix-helix transcriptional regulator
LKKIQQSSARSVKNILYFYCLEPVSTNRKNCGFTNETIDLLFGYIIFTCGWVEDRKSRERTMKTHVETSSILLDGIDEMIANGYFNNRTEAVNEAISQMLERYKLGKLRMKEQQTELRKKTTEQY